MKRAQFDLVVALLIAAIAAVMIVIAVMFFSFVKEEKLIFTATSTPIRANTSIPTLPRATATLAPTSTQTTEPQDTTLPATLWPAPSFPANHPPFDPNTQPCISCHTSHGGG